MFVRSPALALLGLLLLGACGLPPNTAVGDWARSASIGTNRPGFATPPHAAPVRAMQQALGIYFTAIGVLWDNAELDFRAAEFMALAPDVGIFDPAAGEAIRALATNLRAASNDRPLQSLPRDNAGPRPLPEDWRLANLIGASDGAVQLLLASLARAVRAEPVPAIIPPAATADPALGQLQREAAQEQQIGRSARLAARQDYARMLTQIAAAHAMLKAQGRLITQREVERQIFLTDDRLRRAIAALPREVPMDLPPR